MSLLLTRYKPSNNTSTRPPRVAPIPIPALTAVDSDGDPLRSCDVVGLAVGGSVVYTVAAAMLGTAGVEEGISERGKLALRPIRMRTRR